MKRSPAPAKDSPVTTETKRCSEAVKYAVFRAMPSVNSWKLPMSDRTPSKAPVTSLWSDAAVCGKPARAL